LHDRIWNKTYTGGSDLIFWMNGSLDLHNIVEFPVNVDRLIHEGKNQVFNFLNQCTLEHQKGCRKWIALSVSILESAKHKDGIRWIVGYVHI